MTDAAILQELGLPLFVPRQQKTSPTVIPTQAETQENAPALLDPCLRGDDKSNLCAIFLAETQADFSEAHHTQLSKIMAYLGYQETEYQLIFTGRESQGQGLVSFGVAKTTIHTHSISTMLQNPAIKREVLHAIQPLRRNP